MVPAIVGRGAVAGRLSLLGRAAVKKRCNKCNGKGGDTIFREGPWGMRIEHFQPCLQCVGAGKLYPNQHRLRRQRQTRSKR